MIVDPQVTDSVDPLAAPRRLAGSLDHERSSLLPAPISTGRRSAFLPESTRLLIVKSDGSILVHADAGGYKPLNSGLT